MINPMVWIFEVDDGDGDHEVEFIRKVDFDDAIAEKDREIEELKSENVAMYGAILEAADSGSIRCKLELQRIAKEDVRKETK